MSFDLQKLLNIFSQKKIKNMIQQCVDIGIGYLSLDRTMTSLSKGEYQRIRIAKAICSTTKDKTLYILDEPSKGLHISDMDCIIHSIKRLVKNGNTVIAIEHNLDVIAKSDYIIEFGPGPGETGGKIIYSGIPQKILEFETKTAAAFRKRNEKKELSRKKNVQTNEFKIPWNGIDVPIKLNKVNRIHGNIATGKSIIAREILFGGTLKKYVSATNAQGKYITRDIAARECGISGLPLTRLIDGTERFYKKYERLMETLDFDYYVSNMFYKYGVVHCEHCGGETGKPNALEKCGKCGAESHIFIHRNAFAFGKKACKCEVCHGKGKLLAYDFEKILADTALYHMMMKLLFDRTRLSRIAPLLKEKYSIDLCKTLKDMSEEEIRIFLYGDKKKEVLYTDKAKKKVYCWLGCNELINANISYADDDFIKSVKETYVERTCPECRGRGVTDLISAVSYKGISYDDFVNQPVRWVCEHLDMGETVCEEEKVLRQYLDDIMRLGLGSLHLAGYVSDLSIKEKSMIQYLLYKFNPIANSLIVWDDFSAGKTADDLEILMKDFEDVFKAGMSIVILDGTRKPAEADCVLPRNKKMTFHASKTINQSVEYGCSVEEDSFENAQDRLDMILYGRTSAATISDTVSVIRTIFKKKNAKYNYSKQHEIEKCPVCDGTGFYEINTGVLGMSKIICPDCRGTGFSEEVNSVQVNGFSYPQLLNSSIQTVYDWLQSLGDVQTANDLKTFIDLGLGEVKYCSGLNELSYNECSILLLIKYIKSAEKDEVWLKNMFIDIEETVFNALLSSLNGICSEYRKKIHLIR